MLNPVAEFESAFAKLIGSSYAIAVNSGTSALHAALVACDVKGHEVVVPALCPAMDAFAIIHAGGIPIFADVDPLTHLMNNDTLAKALSPRTKAVIAVALHGLPCDMEPILRTAHSWGALVIDDCAQCLLGRYQDGYAGTKADIGCFSFEKKKHMTTGSEGGMIVTNNADLAIKARKFAGIGYKHMTAEAGRTSLNAADFQRPDYERFDTVGLNYRMSEDQADLGLIKLSTIHAAVERRQFIGYLWQHAIGEALQPHTYDADNTFYSAAWPYDGDWIALYQEFVVRGGDGFYAMPKVAYQEPALSGRWSVYCPVAEALQKSLVCFKTHYEIEKAQEQADILARLIHG